MRERKDAATKEVSILPCQTGELPPSSAEVRLSHQAFYVAAGQRAPVVALEERRVGAHVHPLLADAHNPRHRVQRVAVVDRGELDVGSSKLPRVPICMFCIERE